ncbi:hypothetical protein LUZ63_012021 [Rhynchospora breviuscula]|uniref:Pentatricopeptide repeat-containing protein n=1 Tax=Rhynchospora breviuscula TaxID=2022672 RepID=A0A9Q0HRK5_9POAL|nr:hypothetical protein LUZ63_012021 [Rhynchospora breviuscula]
MKIQISMATFLSEFFPHCLRLPPPSLNFPKPTHFLCFSNKPYSNFNSILSNTNHYQKTSSPPPPPPPKSNPECTPDPTHLDNRLRRFLLGRKYTDALSLVESMANQGYKLNIVLCSDLIKCFSSLGKIDCACRVMDLTESYSKPNNFLYNVFITGLCHNNRVILALETLGRMQVHGCRPNILTGNIIVGSLCHCGMLDLAFRTVDHLEQSYNCKPNLITYTKLVQGTVVERGTKEGMRLLDDMASKGIIPDHSTYNAVVQGMCKAGRVDEAWQFLVRLPARGFEPHVEAYSALLQALLESERWIDVDKLIDEMLERACEINNVQLAQMVKMLCQKMLTDKAWSLIDQADKRWGMKPDAKCRNLVIYAYIKEGRLDLATDFIQHMTSIGCAPDIVTYNTILSGLCKHGFVQQALQILHQMEAVGCRPNSRSYYLVAKGLWIIGDFAKAANLLSQMLKKGLKADEAIYSGLISGFCKEGLVDEAMETWSLMEEAGITPTKAIYDKLLQGLAKVRRLVEVIDLFEDMLKKGLKPNEKTYTVILVGMAHMGYVLEAADIVKELGWKNVLSKDSLKRIRGRITRIS